LIEVVTTTTNSSASTRISTFTTQAPTLVTTRPGTSPTKSPDQAAPYSSGLPTKAKMGIGIGLGGGGIIGIWIFYYFFYQRKSDETNVVHSGTDTENVEGGATSRMHTSGEVGTTEGTYLPDKQSHVVMIQQV
jgi:hypothetical protein